MKKIFLIITLFISLDFVFINDVSSWDNEKTHRDLSSIAVENSVLSKNKGDYLKNLGFNKELKEEFKWGEIKKTILDWLAEGAFLEDAGSDLDAVAGKARFNNHFHNPLKSWGTAGLSDMQSGESSLMWAQDSEKQSAAIGGDWSWQKVRLCYYNALTVQKETDRQVFFACTFQGLGYQIHLIQDTSQPAHVRNDAHPWDGKGWVEGLETWAKKNPTQNTSWRLLI